MISASKRLVTTWIYEGLVSKHNGPIYLPLLTYIPLNSIRKLIFCAELLHLSEEINLNFRRRKKARSHVLYHVINMICNWLSIEARTITSSLVAISLRHEWGQKTEAKSRSN
jgi:hypothetical protein